ncbi:MAG: diguanylate cyclase [Solirubrobacterales bacterium]
MQKTLRILIVDDDPADAELILYELRRSGFSPVYERVDGPDALRRALTEQTWDIVTCDHYMPFFNAPDILLQAQSLCPNLPVIILSGEINIDLAVTLMKQGAADFVRKNDLKRLPFSIERELENALLKRNQTEALEALKKSEAHLRALIDNLPFDFFAMDTDLRYTMQNASCIKKYGSFVGRRMTALDVPETLRPKWKTSLKRCLKGTIIRTEFKAEHDRKAEVRELTVAPVIADGQVIGLVGVDADITHHKQIEEELLSIKSHLEELVATRTAEYNRINETLQLEIAEKRMAEKALIESEMKYRALFEHSGIAMVMVDEDMTVLMANEVVEDMTGFTREQMEGKMKWTEFVANSEDLERMVAYHRQRRADADSAPNMYTFRMVDRFRESREAVVNVALLPGSMQSLVSLLDITPQKRAEEELRQMKDELELKVAIRTRELQAANEELRRLSFVDGLTGIANRRYYDEFLQREWHRAKRVLAPLGLIMMDIDYFKDYNDSYGHLAGDSCLKAIAATLRRTVKRSTDLVARYGGDELAVILPNTELSGANSIAEELRQNVAQLAIEHEYSSVASVVTISLGVVSIIPDRDDEISRILRAADQALYEAKQRGRNQVFAKKD